jgi:hypothetical protein
MVNHPRPKLGGSQYAGASGYKAVTNLKEAASCGGLRIAITFISELLL